MLDRDGVINVDRPTSVKKWEEFTFLPFVADAIHSLNQANIPVAIITNQAVVGRQEIGLEKLNFIHFQMQKREPILIAFFSAQTQRLNLITVANQLLGCCSKLWLTLMRDPPIRT